MTAPTSRALGMTLVKEDGALELVCTKCTRAEYFPAADRTEAYMRAALKGWLARDEGRTVICPKCSGVKPIKNV